MLHSNEKEGLTDTCDNMDASQKHDVEKNGSDTEYTKYDSVYMKP